MGSKLRVRPTRYIHRRENISLEKSGRVKPLRYIPIRQKFGMALILRVRATIFIQIRTAEQRFEAV